MTTPIIREPDGYMSRFRGAEACCFCHQPTTYWTNLPSRTPGEQVACCPWCADIFTADVVPTKDAWLDYHLGREVRP